MIIWLIIALIKVALAFFIVCFPFWLSFRFYDQAEAWIKNALKRRQNHVEI